MERKRIRKLIREASYVLEVEVEGVLFDPGETPDPWSPSYSVADAQRLYDAAQAMRARDWDRARAYGALYRLEPVAAA